MSVLLLGADDYGTLAAVRCYGRSGIEVTVASEHRRGRAQFSRYAARRVVHPPLSAPDQLVEWLVDWGDRHPGTFIYPSNDDLAWLYARYRDRLGRSFLTFGPGEATMLRLLDKLRLAAACAEVGIETPRTVGLTLASTDRETADRLAHARYPLLLKPRVRVMSDRGMKGFIVPSPDALASQLARYRALATFDPGFTARHRELTDPIAQEYHSVGETSTLSLAGFVDAGGDCVALAATKILQRPRRVGIGLCFDDRALDASLVERVAALCRLVGYHGVFEVEFLVAADRLLLIDFNPRFYSQMGFEIARGLQLPLLVWRAAHGEAPARDGGPRPRADGQIYSHKRMLDLMLVLQRLSGRMSGDEVARWRTWHRRARRAGRATDAVHDPDDRIPALVDGARWIGEFARHPRSFMYEFVLNR
jgi:D-aspartate ligase